MPGQHEATVMPGQHGAGQHRAAQAAMPGQHRAAQAVMLGQHKYHVFRILILLRSVNSCFISHPRIGKCVLA